MPSETPPRRAFARVASWLLASWLILPVGADPAAGQSTSARPDTSEVDVDPSDLVSHARAAQARFERRRIRHLPSTFTSYGGGCDEVVGRFCSWHDGSSWYPPGPEAPEIVSMRGELLATLDSVWRAVPGSDWVLGQRVWYLVEAGDPVSALAAARGCGEVEPWWCAALEGFALHELQRYVEAEDRFERVLRLMDEERAREWRIPTAAAGRDARGLLEGLETAPADSVARVLDRLWLLADPLYLVEGNDRKTAHYARWTVSTIRDRARNPFGISWGWDLEQLTVRNGWAVGWERARLQGTLAEDKVVSHKHPEGRDFMPGGEALANPGKATADDLRADLSQPRSLYAPAYAPLLLPMEGQLAVFPRGREMIIVATHFVPPDTSRHALHDHPRPWLEPGSQAGMPDRAGLFLVAEGRPARAATASGRAEGALLLRAPAGAYLASVEAWSPPRRQGGRLRVGLEVAPTPEDVATLSDILMLAPAPQPPEQLEAAVPRALLRPEIRPGQTFAIAWEVTGLGFRPEGLAFEVAVVKTGRGVLSRIGDFLRITRPPEPIELTWQEPGPDQPSVLFRHLDLDLPPLDPGDYEIRLTLHTQGRAPATTTRTFKVVER